MYRYTDIHIYIHIYIYIHIEAVANIDLDRLIPCVTHLVSGKPNATSLWYFGTWF